MNPNSHTKEQIEEYRREWKSHDPDAPQWLKDEQALINWLCDLGIAALSDGPADAVRYERFSALDKRISRGDDFAGDAWVRWTAIGHSPSAATEGRQG